MAESEMMAEQDGRGAAEALRLGWFRRRWVQAVADGEGVALAFLFAVFLRYDFKLSKAFQPETILLAACFGAFVVGTGVLVGLYKGRWKFGSFEELTHLLVALALAFVALGLVELAAPALRTFVPFGALTLGAGFALMALAAGRYAWRISEERRVARALTSGRRVVVAGAGEGGEQIVRALRAKPEAGRRPVAFIDDDPRKRHLILYGVRVMGTLDQLERVAGLTGAEELLIAMPSVNSELVTRLTEEAERVGLSVTVLPGVGELKERGGKVAVEDIRKVSVVDLLGREPIDRDLTEVAAYVSGRTVLVTGAGGSIGTELCRQLQRLDPRQVLLFDHDETNLHGLMLELKGRALLDEPEIILGDIRDRPRLESVFSRHQPDIVFHAAAHKHLPLLEMHPCEAVKTNVLGTINVAEVAARHGCSRFVNISTDKAVEPTSVLGATKNVAELVCQWVGERHPGTIFASVRFGNVLGSRGSLVPVIERQISEGGPITLTHPEATRYFMTIPEAAQLVIQAGALAEGGEVFVLDMGQPLRIRDLAEQLVLAAGSRGVPIAYTGLRAGEKLHEKLFDDGVENPRRVVESSIFALGSLAGHDDLGCKLEPVLRAAEAGDDTLVRDRLPGLVPSYRPATVRVDLDQIYPDGL